MLYNFATIKQSFNCNLYNLIVIRIGYSLLQGGPLPCFFSERQLQTFFTEDSDKTEIEEQFMQGIASFGIPQVCKKLLQQLFDYAGAFSFGYKI